MFWWKFGGVGFLDINHMKMGVGHGLASEKLVKRRKFSWLGVCGSVGFSMLVHKKCGLGPKRGPGNQKVTRQKKRSIIFIDLFFVLCVCASVPMHVEGE